MEVYEYFEENKVSAITVQLIESLLTDLNCCFTIFI